MLLRRASENIFIFLLQYIGCLFSMPVSFAAGTACAFLFLRGPGLLPGLWLGSYLGSGLVNANCITIETSIILYLHYFFVGPTLVYDRFKNFIKSSLIICIAPLISPNYLANLLGILIVGHSLLLLDYYFSEKLFNKQRSALFSLLVIALMINILSYLQLITYPVIRVQIILLAFTWVILISKFRMRAGMFSHFFYRLT